MEIIKGENVRLCGIYGPYIYIVSWNRCAIWFVQGLCLDRQQSKTPILLLVSNISIIKNPQQINVLDFGSIFFPKIRVREQNYRDSVIYIILYGSSEHVWRKTGLFFIPIRTGGDGIHPPPQRFFAFYSKIFKIEDFGFDIFEKGKKKSFSGLAKPSKPPSFRYRKKRCPERVKKKTRIYDCLQANKKCDSQIWYLTMVGRILLIARNPEPKQLEILYNCIFSISFIFITTLFVCFLKL